MTTLNFDLNFATNNQSLWSNGDAFSVEDNKFLGVNWQDKKFNKSFLSVGVEGKTNGKVGLQSDFKLDAGSVNASLPLDLWLDIPSEVKPGETITINSGFSLDNTASFSTVSPNASYDLDLIFDVDAQVKGKAFGFKKDFLNFDENHTKNLLNIDSDNISYSLSENQLKGFGSFDLHVPKVDTTGSINGSNSLSAQGSDKFLDANLDLDKVATTLLNTVGVPIPPLEGSGSINLGIAKLSGGYNILDVELASDLSLNQKFDLEVEDVTGEIILENGEKINFEVGQPVTFTVPEGIGDSLEIDAFVDLDAEFSNQTSLDYNADAKLQALSLNGSVKLNNPWPIPDVNKGFSVGPLVNQNFDLFDGNINLYNKTFDLGGLNTESFSFDIAAEDTTTPITTTWEGTPGDDTFDEATQDNVYAYAYGGNDYVWTGYGNDVIYGDGGNDTLKGYDGNDSIFGGDGNDQLLGELGNDNLQGEAGDDILTGVDEWSSSQSEYDILSGGSGADTFVLGNSVKAFYNNDGFSGYAQITDFDWQDGDKFQVFGSLDDYTVSEFNGGMDIYYQDDLIAWVSNTTDVIPSDDFIFA